MCAVPQLAKKLLINFLIAGILSKGNAHRISLLFNVLQIANNHWLAVINAWGNVETVKSRRNIDPVPKSVINGSFVDISVKRIAKLALALNA